MTDEATGDTGAGTGSSTGPGRGVLTGAQFARGALMGAADVVPGVSGGTVALVLGIYQHLVHQVSNGSHVIGAALKGKIPLAWSRFRELDWWFLIPLVAGIGVAVVALAGVIEHLLDSQPLRMAALFFGLVLGSVVVASRLVQGWDGRRFVTAAIAAVVTFFVLGYQSGPVASPSLIVFFLAGAIAICAMILPGISGSFLLLMLGMYDNVLGAVNDREFVILLVFIAGCVTGLALFSQILHWSLVHHERTVLAGLIGLMVGSLRVLWPWPDGTSGNAPLELPSGDVVIPILIAAVGFAVVLVITAVGERVAHRTDADLATELGSD